MPPSPTAQSVSLEADLEADVIVVGAGPAGTAAAITAVDAGLTVIVIDKARFPRDKCCGDGLTTLALRQLDELGLEPSTVPSWFDVETVWLRSPSGREVELPLPSEGRFSAVAPRRELDDALVRLARARGVTVLENHSFTDIAHSPDAHSDAGRVTVHATHTLDGATSPVTIVAKWVVAADGMWSPVRKALGVGHEGYLGEWHAFRQYADNVTGVAKDRLIVWFEEDLLPGYAWSFPVRGGERSSDGAGRVNIGFGVMRDESRRGRDMKALWADFLSRPHIVEALGPGFRPDDRHTAWPIPARIDDAVTGSGRVLFTGDAVMATDLLTGEGIGQALLTGAEAARAIVSGVNESRSATEVRRTYAESVRRHLLADHRMSVRLSKILAHSRGARGAIALVAKSGSWGRRNFARWMFEDEPRAIIVTPRRWHRRLFRQRGAY